ncbi:MAG: nitronate monooxygenase [Rhodospirillaceae bacterium]|nr:nitronate monooxygenase [Rhodospirillaceae bacterium]
MPDNAVAPASVAEKIADIKERLAVPAFAAPMFLVSGPDLVIAACKAGVIGAFPTMNARPISALEEWFERITKELADAESANPGTTAPWAANIICHSTSKRFDEDFALLQQYKPEIVITALGSPKRVIKEVHDYGGLVFADVNSVTYAKKAVGAGADGLVLVSAGAGGHTGFVTGFAFVPAIRSFFDGPIILGGGIVDGAGIRAAEVLGADFGYLGTRFIATEESVAPESYRDMLVNATEEDIIQSAHFTGVPANYLKTSIIAAGLDPDTLKPRKDKSFDSRHDGPENNKAWKDIWSAGQGVRAVDKVQPVSALVKQLKAEYDIARAMP